MQQPVAKNQHKGIDAGGKSMKFLQKLLKNKSRGQIGPAIA
jgi:hypothetical protein